MSATKAEPKSRSAKVTKPSLTRQQQLRQAALLFQKASVPTRFQVLLMLSQGERSVGELCAEVEQTQPAMSHHLAILRHSGIVRSRRHGYHSYYQLTELGEQLAAIAGATLGM